MSNIEYKLAIIVRKDLRMGKGKIAAQASHASVIASERIKKINANWWESWINRGQRKIVLKIESKIDLFKIKEEAEKTGLPTSIVQDSGLTQLEPGTVTCIAIGPAPSKLIDKITKELSLL
ncbi:peptidyl-tRNA hydrolase [miscellaneous Crenarchaeota group archaeon SMTZ-80]|nr:MAG: peptidyl-tRNA hydrolase [miscellaneous Crenarchaeota group archaeon SMTZ-80]